MMRFPWRSGRWSCRRFPSRFRANGVHDELDQRVGHLLLLWPPVVLLAPPPPPKMLLELLWRPAPPPHRLCRWCRRRWRCRRAGGLETELTSLR